LIHDRNGHIQERRRESPTDERWSHITEEHAELAGYRLEVVEAIAEPERILAGGARTPRVEKAKGW